MSPFDGEPSSWVHHTAFVAPGARLHYVDASPNPNLSNGHTIVLVHGFPQTWYCWRHVIQHLADLGYRVIAVDYRGAGASSKPEGGYDKKTMANDIRTLYKDNLGVDKAIVIGYDIGYMVVVALAAHFSDDVEALVGFESPIPGTSGFKELTSDFQTGVVKVPHFWFHAMPDLPELLIQGKEREYMLGHFFSRESYDPSFLTPADLDVYVRAYSQAGGIRAGLGVYRAFSQDKADFEKSFATKGRIKLPCLTLTSEGSAFTPQVTKQTHEYAEDATFASIPHANHYIPEENPKAFVEAVSEWLESKIPRR